MAILSPKNMLRVPINPFDFTNDTEGYLVDIIGNRLDIDAVYEFASQNTVEDSQDIRILFMPERSKYVFVYFYDIHREFVIDMCDDRTIDGNWVIIDKYIMSREYCGNIMVK